MTVVTFFTPASALRWVSAHSTALPPFAATSMNGMFLRWNMSPVCMV
jgi:hypothetical protein